MGSAAVPAMKIFRMLPRAAETYRRQIALGFEGDPRATLKARSILRECSAAKCAWFQSPMAG